MNNDKQVATERKPWDPSFIPTTAAELDMHFMHMMEHCEGMLTKHFDEPLYELDHVRQKLKEASYWAKEACFTLIAKGGFLKKPLAPLPLSYLGFEVGEKVKFRGSHPQRGRIGTIASIDVVDDAHHPFVVAVPDCAVAYNASSTELTKVSHQGFSLEDRVRIKPDHRFGGEEGVIVDIMEDMAEPFKVLIHSSGTRLTATAARLEKIDVEKST